MSQKRSFTFRPKVFRKSSTTSIFQKSQKEQNLGTLQINHCVLLNVKSYSKHSSKLLSDHVSGGSDPTHPGGLKGGSNSNSGLVVPGGGSGLHQFVTRYTIERPDDPSRTGIEVCLTGDDPLDPIIEVECGGNKGLLYVSKLCQGSKGN